MFDAFHSRIQSRHDTGLSVGMSGYYSAAPLGFLHNGSQLLGAELRVLGLVIQRKHAARRADLGHLGASSNLLPHSFDIAVHAVTKEAR